MTLSGTLVFFTNWVKACHIGSPDWEFCCFEIGVSGCTWAMTPVLGDPNVTAFLKATFLHWFCSTCNSTTCSYTWPKIHLDWRHMSRHSRPIHQRTGMQSLVRYGAECECHTSVNLSSRQWRLKPSASKTISTVFHVHNTSATRELSVYLDGQHLWHECHPTYLGVTLDRTENTWQRLQASWRTETTCWWS